MGDKALCGLDLICTNDLASQYTSFTSSGFSFFCIDLFHPKLVADVDETSKNLIEFPLTRSDLVYHTDGKSISMSLVGKVSRSIDVDSVIPDIRRYSEKALARQLSWAAYLGLPAVRIDINRSMNPNLVRLLLNFVRSEYIPIKIWLKFPMSFDVNNLNEGVSVNKAGGDCSELLEEHTPDDPFSTPWHWWFHLSNMAADATDAFGIILELPANLPDEKVVMRWFSEPVVCLLVGTDLFLTNAKGCPVLPKSHQQIIKRFFKLNVQILLTGVCRHDKGYLSYQQYITWLWKTQAAPDLYDEQSKGLEDQLQEPLQPLRDNLSSTTYSIFEMDPYKYQAYENAIFKALCDRTSSLTSSSSEDINHTQDSSNSCQVVIVLGAGRGPLVNAVLNAAEKSKCTTRIYVVEKNPNALLTLQSRMNHEWRGLDVHLVAGDMRNLKIPEKADIFVSELLGSFGDNELSPECLDGAQPMLKNDGISIPCSYTSYVAPLQSLQIHNETKRSRDMTNRVGYSLETPYVVRLLNCQILDEPQEAFTFVHPKPNLEETNTRYVCCCFNIQQDAVIHGIAGYFEAVLYKDVTLSIHPNRHSPQMVSWFPLVFPIDQPVSVRAGERVKLCLWRLTDSRHVWYEWALIEPRPTRVHNVAGHAYKIAL